MSSLRADPEKDKLSHRMWQVGGKLFAHDKLIILFGFLNHRRP